MRSVLAYTSARILIFVGTFAVLYVLGFKSFLGLLVAALVSGLISYILLSRQRDKMSAGVVDAVQRGRQRLADGASREDEEA